MSTPTVEVDQDKLQQFLGKAVGDMGAAMNTVLIVLGERLGLYKAMAGAGPLTPAELASRTGTHERYVREWLCAQAAGGLSVLAGTAVLVTAMSTGWVLSAAGSAIAFLPNEIGAALLYNERVTR